MAHKWPMSVGIYEGAADLLTWLKTEKKMNIGLIRNSKVTEAAMRHRISKGKTVRTFHMSVKNSKTNN